MQSNTSTDDLVGKIVGAIRKDYCYSEIKAFLAREGRSENEIETLLKAAYARIEAEKRVAIKERLAASRTTLKQNDNGIDDTMVERMCKLIEGRCPLDELDSFNSDLAKKGRRLTYRDLALVACIHKRSIKENKGQSPFKRFTSLTSATDSPLDNRQVRYALTILEAVDFTAQEDSHSKGEWKEDKYIKGKAGTWTLSDDPYWFHDI